MDNKNREKKMRIPVFILGIIMFILLTLSSVIKNSMDEDYIDFKLFRNRLKSNSYSILQDGDISPDRRNEGFESMLQELDLNFNIVLNSRFMTIYRKMDRDLNNSMLKIEDNWRDIYTYFQATSLPSEKILKSAITTLSIELEKVDRKFETMEVAGGYFFLIVVSINLVVFVGLLVTVFYLTNRKNQAGTQGLMSVRTALIQGQEQERLRISLELHDKVAQDLFAARMVINELKGGADSEDSIQAFSKSVELIDQSIKEVRDLSYSLRPPALQAIGLDSAFNSYIDNFSKKIGVPISFKAVGLANKNIDESVSINLYRILQETLNNTAKHAHADSIDVKLIYSYPYLLLKIEDDGVGFNYVKSEIKAKGNRKLGLPGINERTSLLGGELIINSSKGEGTKILIKVPVEGYEKN